MECGWFSKCGSRLGAARIRLKQFPTGTFADGFENVALAFGAAHILLNVFPTDTRTDGIFSHGVSAWAFFSYLENRSMATRMDGGSLFKAELSPERRAERALVFQGGASAVNSNV